jgi:hypothetical protein
VSFLPRHRGEPRGDGPAAVNRGDVRAWRGHLSLPRHGAALCRFPRFAELVNSSTSAEKEIARLDLAPVEAGIVVKRDDDAM